MEEKSSNVILEPIVTEKSTALGQQSKYTFKVAKGLTKSVIRKAFAEIFPGRKILKVQTMTLRGHKKRTKSSYTKPKDGKKAVITIEGAKLDYFPEVS